MVKVTPAVFIDGKRMLVPVNDAVQEAIRTWFADNVESLAEVLKPYGLHPSDIAAPDFERVLTKADVEVIANVYLQ